LTFFPLCGNLSLTIGENMDIKQLKTSACETTFEVDGEQIRLWIIVGGTPALGFSDYAPYEQRYPSLEKWASNHFNSRKNLYGSCYYDHQDPKNVQGPLLDVLPDGEKSLEAFLNTFLPRKQLCMRRYNMLPFKDSIQSKKVRDKCDHTYAYANLELRRYILSPVTISSAIYAGRCEKKLVLFPEWWQKTAAIINPLFDRCVSTLPTWDSLIEEEYQEFVNQLKEYDYEH